MQPDTDIAGSARDGFAADLAKAKTQEAVFAALHRLSDSHFPVRLWTVMTLDLQAGLARRAYSSRPDTYPPSGTKPIVANDWFEVVHGQHRSFVANTLADIAKVFPDHAVIGALGCASVMNLPVISGDDLLATVNLLDGEGYFTPQRVKAVTDALAEPALVAMLAARALAKP